MFKRLTSVIAIVTICTLTSYAKIWRVNNNSGVTADFTTLQAAHDGASAGDTLHLESSPNSYGSLQCSKRIIILGTGYYLNENTNQQALPLSSKVDGINLNDGSAGTVIMGLDFSSNTVNVYAHNIVISRNKFSDAATTFDWSTGSIGIQYAQNNGSIGASNIVITQNFGVRIIANYASTDLLINNNYIAGSAWQGDATNEVALRLHANASAIIKNNIFRRGTVSAYNSSFTNNIMYVGTLTTDNTGANNIGSGSQFGTANGNKSNVDMSTVFVGPGTGVSPDAQWKLKSGSPAIGAGYGSTNANPVDAGIFGGQNSYVLAGLPPIPSIYYYDIQPVGSNSDPIDVSIKVKSNN